MTPNWYPVYKVQYKIALPDPHMPPGRLHHAIFVQTNKDGSGTLYHVIGDITSTRGMTYQSKKTRDPATSESFRSRKIIGYTCSDTHPGQWTSVLSSLPTPPQQKASNPSNGGRVEPFKEKVSDYTYVFYKPGEEREPLWKCTEWVEWYAIPALEEHGLVQAQVPDASSST
jgi:hypothetical protein